MQKLVLGSNSPRRSELLAKMGFAFERVKIDCDETFDEKLPVIKVAEYLAQKKAEAYTSLGEDEVLITADTTVVCDQNILNKPKDAEEAHRMLQILSGRTHQVVTGVCIRTSQKMEVFSGITNVLVSSLTEEDILHYVSEYKPFDKAGAYGIQEWFGVTQIEKIDGCFYNVMGLPCEALYRRLKRDYEV